MNNSMKENPMIDERPSSTKDSSMAEGQMGENVANLPLKEYNRQQMAILTSPDHVYYTGQAIGREPTHEDLVEHWFNRGGREEFNRRHHILTEEDEQSDKRA